MNKRIQALRFSEPTDRISLRTPHETCDKNLKEQLNSLLAPREPARTHFNHDFYTFRQKLSNAKNRPDVQFDRLVQSLHTYLFNRLEKNLAQTSPQTEILQRYLRQCLDRITHPLPKHLQSIADKLLELYHDKHNLSASLQKHYKFVILTTLMQTIKKHPEKTYTECYRLTTNIARTAILGLEAEQPCLTFFRKHRFKHFITRLLEAEPDYEQPHPGSTADLNHHTHNDASRFSC